MHYPDKARVAAQAYFSSFSRLFGKTPNFPSGEERKAALDSMTRIVTDAMKKYDADDYAAIDNEVLDFMEELINSYE